MSAGWSVCCQLVGLSPACPVHALIRQRDRVHELARQIGVDPLSMPVFPTSDGDEVTKHDGVQQERQTHRRSDVIQKNMYHIIRFH